MDGNGPRVCPDDRKVDAAQARRIARRVAAKLGLTAAAHDNGGIEITTLDAMSGFFPRLRNHHAELER